jgi:hypothetical protein
MSFISNSILISSKINNLVYQRRHKAEVSNGIGNWLICIYALSQFSIFTNCYFIYFTSNIVKSILYSTDNYITGLTGLWTPIQLIIMIIIIEHFLLILKMVIEHVVDEIPKEV